MATDPKQKSETRPDEAGKGRFAALVIAMTGALWVGSTWAGDALGWSARVRALIDLAALGGFAFGLIVTFRIWRARQRDEG